MRDDSERRLAARLHAYESRVPDREPPPLESVRRGPPLPALIGGGALAAVAVALVAVVILQPSPDPVGGSSPTPVASGTVDASPSSAPTTSPLETPGVAPTAPASASPEPTLGPIVRWATAASFGPDGHAEEVRDIAYAAGHFVAVGYREPLNARGQVGPYPHDPLVWISLDGTSWSALALGPEFDGADVHSVVALPDGSAAIYGWVDRDPDPMNTDEAGLVMWRSTDGSAWEQVDLVRPADSGDPRASITHVVDGPKGYLSSTTWANDSGLVDELWFSTDGITWELVRRFQAGDDGWTTSLHDYEAGAEGFVLTGMRYEVESDDRTYVPVVQASSDGRTWFDAEPGTLPDGPDLLVAPIGGDWIMTATNSGDGTDTAWFSANGLAWERRGEIDVPLPASAPAEDSVPLVGTLLPAGDRVFVSGAVQICCHTPWWAAGIWSSFDGSQWERLGFPEDTVIRAAATHGEVTVLAGHTGASPDAWEARATFWVSERE